MTVLKSQRSIYIIFATLVVAFASLTYFHDVIKTAVFSDFEDFGNYYLYSKALSLKYNIYTLDEATKKQLMREFKMPLLESSSLIFTPHSPIYSTLIRGITFFEYRLAAIIWLLLNNILLFSSILIILKLIYEKMEDIDKKFIFASSVFLVLVFHPLAENIGIGQVNPLIFFFFALCLYLLNNKRYILSGLALSLGILIKPFLIILLPFFLWKRCYRVFFSALISFITLEFLGIFINGIDIYLGYLNTISRILLPSINNMSMCNLSLGTLINRVVNLAMHPHFIYITTSLTLLLYLFFFICLFYITKSRFRGLDLKFILEFSLVIIFTLIASPIVHEHHYILLYFPILFLWAKLSVDGQFFSLFLFFISFLLIGLKYSLIRFPIFYTGPLAIFSGLKLYGVIALFFLTAYEISKISQKLK